MTTEVLLFDFFHFEVFFQAEILHLIRNKKIAVVPSFFHQSECVIRLFITKPNQKTESVSKNHQKFTKKFYGHVKLENCNIFLLRKNILNCIESVLELSSLTNLSSNRYCFKVCFEYWNIFLGQAVPELWRFKDW